MQRVLSIFMALCISLTFALDAHAKRFGGGKSFGSAPSHQTRQAPQQTQAAPNQAGRQTPAAASGASRWLGPLAGLAAGGLLASMFMGDGFEGIQFMDILIFGLIAFLLFRFLAARRRQQQPAMAGHAPMQREMPQQPATSIFGGSAAPAAAPVINAPAWFNEQSFVAAAREHFLALQQHWDANEMDKIAEFVTPQLLGFLKQERAEIGDAYQSTYIDDLQIQLDGVDDNAEKTTATLTFSGVAKTSRFDQGEPFSESWRMERVQGENQPWLVAGIRQNA
ncbi:Tim44 domain-containing protein [Stutzerimonas stutzeri]|uniref:Tim44 domain-containing protein n=1 Tax=Stutzerimonas stutzeri TaxID=316 RepID=UPI000F706B03|nr:TIM44-like domain-containing protein [Stutzerimonas stutzeri]VEF17644.1 import inner membrane translocase subunit Tim44 [Stutzerimonas stutzeri]